MTNAQIDTLVLKDQAGDYFLLPLTMLERGRVPAEHRSELERLIPDTGDVSGHAVYIAAVGIGLIVVGGILYWGPGGGGDRPIYGAIMDGLYEGERQFRRSNPE